MFCVIFKEINQSVNLHPFFVCVSLLYIFRYIFCRLTGTLVTLTILLVYKLSPIYRCVLLVPEHFKVKYPLLSKYFS